MYSGERSTVELTPANPESRLALFFVATYLPASSSASIALRIGSGNVGGEQIFLGLFIRC